MHQWILLLNTQSPLDQHDLRTHSLGRLRSNICQYNRYATLPIYSFQHRSCSCRTELSSVALGGSVASVSDEFFAEAFHLLLVQVSRSFLLRNTRSLIDCFATPLSLRLVSRGSLVPGALYSADGKLADTILLTIGACHALSVMGHVFSLPCLLSGASSNLEPLVQS